jgi:hypothetical protein
MDSREKVFLPDQINSNETPPYSGFIKLLREVPVSRGAMLVPQLNCWTFSNGLVPVVPECGNVVFAVMGAPGLTFTEKLNIYTTL